MSKKFLFALIGIVMLAILMLAWLISKVTDTALWALWFAALSGTIGIYTAGNVAQSSVISKNYRPELDTKTK